MAGGIYMVKKKKKTLCERCRCKKCRDQKRLIQNMTKMAISNLAWQIWFDALKESKIIGEKK